MAREVENLWALAFTLEYDPSVISFDSAERRDFLGSSDHEVELIASEAPGRRDRVVVGITRLASPPTVPQGKDGSGHVMVLRFVLEGVGSTTVRFVPNLDALDPDGGSIFQPDDPSLHFFGGNVTAR